MVATIGALAFVGMVRHGKLHEFVAYVRAVLAHHRIAVAVTVHSCSWGAFTSYTYMYSYTCSMSKQVILTAGKLFVTVFCRSGQREL